MEKMICTRLDFWAEKNRILSSTQYGFGKGRGTRDFSALLTTVISTSLDMKEQTVAAFLDVSGAYDNVFIDVLCSVMLDTELPVRVVRFLRNLLWCKTLVFYVGGVECMTLTSYKGLPQGSVLNPLLYNLLGSGWIYSFHRDVIFSNMRMTSLCTLRITFLKLQVLWFRRRAHRLAFSFQ
jgi:hypothetical protein